MKDDKSKGCERLIRDLTGGVLQPESIRHRRSIVDVKSGNGTRLEVKWSGVTRDYQWCWNVSHNLVPGRYDRMILVGADPWCGIDYYRYFFDVPARWILAWNKRTITCPYQAPQWSRIAYTLYKWHACNQQQIADRYGPGKVQSLEIDRPEELETLLTWEVCRTRERIALLQEFSDQELHSELERRGLALSK
jgi:hypothetical protein